MKDNQQPADDEHISALLRQARPKTDLPPRFQQQVWRRIENAEKSAPAVSWLDTVANLLLRPRLALAAAVIVLLAGVLAGTLDGRQVARHNAQINYLASVEPLAAH